MITHFEREFWRHVLYGSEGGDAVQQAIIAEQIAGSQSEWFSTDERRMICEDAKELAADGKPVTDHSLWCHMRSKARAEAVSDEVLAIMSHLPDKFPVGGLTTLESSARFLHEECERRKRTETATQAAEHVKHGRDDEARVMMESIWDHAGSPGAQGATVSELVKAVLSENLAAKSEGHTQSPNVHPGFYELQHTIGGLQPGSLTVISGNPGDGKSAVMLQMSLAMVSHQPQPVVAYLSIEDPMETVQERLVQKFAKCQRYEPGQLNTAQESVLDKVFRASAFKSVRVEKPARRALESVLACMSKCVNRHGATVLLVDYLNVIQCKGDEYERTTRAVNAVKEEAQRLGVACVLGAQLNRGGRKEEPSLSSLRGSGVIEEVAENVLMLWRTGEYPSEKRHLKVAKAKSGRAGARFNLVWGEDGTMVTDLEEYMPSTITTRPRAY